MPRRSASTHVLDQLRAQRAGTPAAQASPFVRTRPLVGAYERISDANEGGSITTHGIERQHMANENIAAARDWEVHRHYTDNNITAFKTDVIRDDFENLLEDLDSGVIEGIICYNLDRFARRIDDLERAIAIYDKARQEKRTLYFATAEGDLNLGSDDGLTMARVMVAFANKASRDTARRVSAKHASTRDKGGNTGGMRPFGWDVVDAEGPRRFVLNNDEADAIRWAIEGLTTGIVTWGGVVREWNQRGVRTPAGGQWIHASVRNVLRSPRLAGWLVHYNQIAVHSQTGELVRGDFEAIVSDEQYEAFMVATEKIRSKYSARMLHNNGARKYLLSGIARCANCGAKLTGVRRVQRGKEYFYYVCRPFSRAAVGTNGCGRLSINGNELDRLVVDLVLPRIIATTRDVRLDAERPHEARLHELRTEKTQLLADFKEDRATSEMVFPKVTALDAEIDQLRRIQAVWMQEQLGLAKSVGVTEKNWVLLPTLEQRQHVARQVEAIYVSSSKRPGSKNFDPSRVAPPVWRTPSTAAELRPAAAG